MCGQRRSSIGLDDAEGVEQRRARAACDSNAELAAAVTLERDRDPPARRMQRERAGRLHGALERRRAGPGPRLPRRRRAARAAPRAGDPRAPAPSAARVGPSCASARGAATRRPRGPSRPRVHHPQWTRTRGACRLAGRASAPAPRPARRAAVRRAPGRRWRAGRAHGRGRACPPARSRVSAGSGPAPDRRHARLLRARARPAPGTRRIAEPTAALDHGRRDERRRRLDPDRGLERLSRDRTRRQPPSIESGVRRACQTLAQASATASASASASAASSRVPNAQPTRYAVAAPRSTRTPRRVGRSGLTAAAYRRAHRRPRSWSPRRSFPARGAGDARARQARRRARRRRSRTRGPAGARATSQLARARRPRADSAPSARRWSARVWCRSETT